MINVPTEAEYLELNVKVDRIDKKVDYIIQLLEKIYHSRDYSTKEAAAELGFSTKWLLELRKAGRIGSINNGGTIRFTQAHLDEYRKEYNVPAMKSFYRTT